MSCRGSDDGITPNTRIERWVPRTGGSSAFEAGFSTVWAAIGSQTSFNDTCLCGDYIDNGAGLSWVSSVEANATETFTQDTIFSPTGEIAPFITKTAALDEVAAGGQDSYNVTVTNPLGSPVSLNTITDHLPAGFAYIPGTTAGGITVDPTINGQDLTWTGPFDLPAGGTLRFVFAVPVSANGASTRTRSTAPRWVASSGSATSPRSRSSSSWWPSPASAHPPALSKRHGDDAYPAPAGSPSGGSGRVGSLAGWPGVAVRE